MNKMKNDDWQQRETGDAGVFQRLKKHPGMNGLCKAGMGALLICFLLSCAGKALKTGTTTAKAYTPGYQVYLLMGQSNMAGRGALTAEYLAMKYERVWMLDKEYKWVPARHPLHFDKPAVAGVGPGLSFGEAIAKAYPQDTIGLVPCAVGGTTISKWEPGAYDEHTHTHPYDDAVRRIKEAQKKGTIRGIIWLQGEGDSNPKSLEQYAGRIAVLIARLRKEVGDPNLPFIAGELGHYKEKFIPFNQKLAQLPQQVPFTRTVSAAGLKDRGDTLHFDSPSATAYGKRFARGMLELQQKK